MSVYPTLAEMEEPVWIIKEDTTARYVHHDIKKLKYSSFLSVYTTLSI